MGWSSSTRRSRLPSNWAALRDAAFRRAGGRCQAPMLDGSRCTQAATDCDHIVAGDDHSPGNLQALCEWHHKIKTQAEGRAARAALPPVTSRHPGEAHPSGLKLY